MPVSGSSLVRPVALLVAISLALAGYSAADAAADVTEVVIPSQFTLSASADTVTTGAQRASIAGGMQIINTGQTSYLFIPAETSNGAKLVSLHDPVTGIVFRNNTVALPIYQGSGIAAGLVLATEDMMAGREGFFGRIAGAELDIPGKPATRDGYNFSADTAIFLRDIPDDIACKVTTGSSTEARDAINTALLPSELMTLDVPLVIEVSSADPQSAGSIEFMIITINVDSAWVEKYGGKNISVYQLKNGTAVPRQYRALKADDGRIALETVVTAPGTFALATTGNSSGGTGIISSGLRDMLVFCGLLALLISALAIMVRRMVRKRQF